jgi:hypothetical protein
MRGEVRAGRREGVGRRHRERHARGRPDSRLGGQGTRGAHVKHEGHVRDARGVPVGNIRIEILQFDEKAAHVGDGRDVPVGNGAVCRNGGSRISIVGLDCHFQGGLGRENTG